MFNLKLEEINFEKIKSFCEEQIPEGETIEYKADFPSELEKSISAMANTYGGIILIGVEADQITNTPILPIKGRELAKGLEEKVTSICLRKISHPYFPQVKVCPFKTEKGEDKCVIFIRVDESDQTPHAINHNTDVYLRIQSQNQPFRKATVEEIDWLKDRRKKAVELRESLVERARERYAFQVGDKRLGESFRETLVVPSYPSKELFSCYEFQEIIRKMREGANRESIKVALENLPKNYRTATNSVYESIVEKRENFNLKWLLYREFNSFGMIYEKETLRENAVAETSIYFDVKLLLFQLYRVLMFGSLMYKNLGYMGLVRIEANARLGGRTIAFISRANKAPQEVWGVNELGESFHFEKTLYAHKLDAKLDNLVLEVYKSFLWTCGVGMDLDMPDEIDRAKGDCSGAKRLLSRYGFA